MAEKIKPWGWRRIAVYKCRKCGTTEGQHDSDGLCHACYERTRRKYKREYFRKNYMKTEIRPYLIKK